MDFLPSCSCMLIVYWGHHVNRLLSERVYELQSEQLSYRHVHLFHGNHTIVADMERRPDIASYDILRCVIMII